MNKRLYYIDNLRGLLIILVVLGHCIQNLDLDFDHNIVFRYIYSFHMPLFMFISGFVSYKKEYKFISIKRRFIQLVIPFIAWAMLGLTIQGEYNWTWLTQPDTGLWFLWVLFWIGVIHIVLSKLSVILKIEENLIFGISCILFLGILFINKLSFGYHLVAWYLPFYLMGSILKRFENQLFPIINKNYFVLGMLFVILAFYWMRNESPTFININSQALIFGYKFIVGFIGCLFFISLGQFFDDKILYLSELGSGMTFGIYAVHQFVIRLLVHFKIQMDWSDNFWIGVLIAFIFVFGISFLIYRLIGYSRYISKILLGK